MIYSIFTVSSRTSTPAITETETFVHLHDVFPDVPPQLASAVYSGHTLKRIIYLRAE